MAEQVELLAPARDLETGLAAINNGADAVYLGAARFGAREAAGNNLAAVESLVQYAHRYWARVYVTVNTLLFDHELPAAVGLISQLYNLGVDAVIIQDVGLLECDLPPVALFASTQMHNHNPERVAFLEKVGFQRAILARELSIEDIKRVRSATSIELETFIHGALCVCYSGQCYLSYALGGRSGNRGQCAQPCRRRYSLLDGRGAVLARDRYLLSLKDLNLSDHLRDLLDAGVCSFKIEGRLKDRAYVTNIVAHYRRLLDAVLKDSPRQPASSGRSQPSFTPDPQKTFNRGYTTYYLNGRGDPVASPDTPKSTGELLGTVKRASIVGFALDSQAAVHPGDGLCFFDADRELSGTTVRRVQGDEIIPEKMDHIAPGVKIYRNHDQAFLAQLEQSRAVRKIVIQMRLEETPEGYRLSAEDEDGNQASFELPHAKMPAQKPEQAAASYHKQLQSLGGTPFECSRLDRSFDQPYFIPVAALNALRRGLVAALEAAREQKRPRFRGGITPNAAPFPQKRLDFTGNVLNEKARAFYTRHGVESIEPAAEAGLDLHGRTVMTTRHCLKYELGACRKHGGKNSLVEPLVLQDEEGNRFALRFNCADCLMEIIR